MGSPIKGAYHLDLSTPGINRPLTRLKDFATFEAHGTRLEADQPIGGRRRFKSMLAGGDEMLLDIEDPGKTVSTALPRAMHGPPG